jgi:DNA-binding NtrC family response regulator
MKKAGVKSNFRLTTKPHTTTAKERILVVNDEEPIREIVSSMLTSAGYNCRAAADGLEALAVLNSGAEFDLLLTNLMKPNLDGIGLLERTKEEFPDVPVVVETAVHDISVALAAIRSGAYDYVLAPFEREQLLVVVRRAMEYRRLKLENRNCQKKLGALTIPTAPKPEHILVQDDEEPMREIIASMLSSAHYECRGIASPKELLDILRSGEQCDLVLCGLMETLEDGFFDRKSEQFPDIPLVVLSACHDVSLFTVALGYGAYDYLLKPFEREQLLNVVSRALEYRRLKLENRALRAQLAKPAKRNSIKLSRPLRML